MAVNQNSMEYKCDYINMKVADNGFVINYDMQVPNTGDKCYGSMRSESHQEVFSFADGAKAMARMIELAKTSNPNVNITVQSEAPSGE